MDKPDIEFETRARDVFSDRIDYELKGLFGEADEMKICQIKSFMHAVYVEGYLDGFRTADYSQQ